MGTAIYRISGAYIRFKKGPEFVISQEDIPIYTQGPVILWTDYYKAIMGINSSPCCFSGNPQSMRADSVSMFLPHCWDRTGLRLANLLCLSPFNVTHQRRFQITF